MFFKKQTTPRGRKPTHEETVLFLVFKYFFQMVPWFSTPDSPPLLHVKDRHSSQDSQQHLQRQLLGLVNKDCGFLLLPFSYQCQKQMVFWVFNFPNSDAHRRRCPADGWWPTPSHRQRWPADGGPTHPQLGQLPFCARSHAQPRLPCPSIMSRPVTCSCGLPFPSAAARPLWEEQLLSFRSDLLSPPG